MKRSITMVVMVLMAAIVCGTVSAQTPLALKEFKHEASPAGKAAVLKFSDAIEDGGYFRVGEFTESIVLAGTEYAGVGNPGVYLVRHSKTGEEQWTMACRGKSELQEWVVFPDGRVILFLGYWGEMEVHGSALGDMKKYDASSLDGKNNLLILGLNKDGSFWFDRLGKGDYGTNDPGLVFSEFFLEVQSATLSRDAMRLAFNVNAVCDFSLGTLRCETPSYMVWGMPVYAPSSYVFELDLASLTCDQVATFHPTAAALVGETPLAVSAAWGGPICYDGANNLRVASTLVGSVDLKYGKEKIATINLGESNGMANIACALHRFEGETYREKLFQLDRKHESMKVQFSNLLLLQDGKHLLAVGGYQGNLKVDGTVVLEAAVIEDALTYTDYFYALLDAETLAVKGIGNLGVKFGDYTKVTLANLPEVQVKQIAERLYMAVPFHGNFELAGVTYTSRSALTPVDSRVYNSILLDGTFTGEALPEFSLAYPLYSDANARMRSISVRKDGAMVLSGDFSATTAKGVEFFDAKYSVTETEKRDVFIALFASAKKVPVTVSVQPDALLGEVSVRVNGADPIVFKGDPAAYVKLEVPLAAVLTVMATPTEGVEFKNLTVNGVSMANNATHTVLGDAEKVDIVATFAKMTTPQPTPPVTSVESPLLADARVLINPFTDRLTVVGLSGVPVSYTLFNAQGQLVQQGVAGPVEELVIDTPSLSSGLYILRLTGEDGGVRVFRVMSR